MKVASESQLTSKLICYTTIISTPLQQSASGCIQGGRNLGERRTLGVSGVPIVDSGGILVIDML